jgi:hypothetical protein
MSIIKILLLFGAKSTITTNNIEMRLNALLNDAEKKLCQTAATISSSAGQSCMILDHDKQKNYYDQRIKLLKKMISGWYNMKLPDAPFSFAIGKFKIQISNENFYQLRLIIFQMLLEHIQY